MHKIPVATAHRRLFLELFFGGWQNIKKKEVFAAARQDAGPFFFYLFFYFFVIILRCAWERTHKLLCWQLCQWVLIMLLWIKYWLFSLILSSQQDAINISADSGRIILCQAFGSCVSQQVSFHQYKEGSTFYLQTIVSKYSQFVLLTKLSLYCWPRERLKSGLTLQPAWIAQQSSKGQRDLTIVPCTSFLVSLP